MKSYYLVVLLLAFQCVHATTYYFSALSGDDTRTSAQAQNLNTPWMSLNKLNSFFGNLNPGDQILLKRGEVYYGSIIVGKSGTASQPITISAYGVGNKPVISGFTTLTNWVSAGNGIWESTSASFGLAINNVVIDNVPQEIGRFPNRNAPNKGYLQFENFLGNTSITDNELPASTDWVGGEVVIRKRISILDRNIINAQSGNTLFYTSGSTYSPAQNGFGYFIQNHIKTLDQFGEWCYNNTQKKISVFFGSSNPSSYNIKVPVIDNLIFSSYKDNVIFDNLTLQGGNTYGFNLDNGTNMNIRNCDVSVSGLDGVRITNHKNFTIENSTVTNSNSCGINLQFGDTYATIRNNKVYNSYVFPGMAKSGDGIGIGINGGGEGGLMEYNEVIKTGYIGISYQGNYVTVKNNYVDTFCINKDDGGGIYTSTGDVTPIPLFRGRKIIGNIVLNGVGAPEATPGYTFRAEGISLDDNTSGLLIADNTIANCSSYGIYYRNARDIILRNNSFYNNKIQLFMFRFDQIGSLVNNEVVNNIFLSKTSSQLASALHSVSDDGYNFARFDSNFYARPLNDQVVIQNSYVDNYGNNIRSDVYNLEDWKYKSQREGYSNKSPVQIPEYSIKSIIGSNKFANGDFNSGLGNVFGWSAANNIKTSWNSGGKLDGGAIQVAFTSPPIYSTNNADIFQQIGAVSSGKNYRLKFSLLGTDDRMSFSIYLRQTNFPYKRLSDVKYCKISNVRTENEMILSVPVGDNDVTLFFESDNQNLAFWMDNIQLHEADVTLTNPDDYLRFEFNPSQTSKTIELNGNYVDVKNKKYSGSVALSPYSSIVFIKSGNVRADQTIIFPGTPSKDYGTAPFNISATASSGLPVSFRIISGPATVSGSTVSLTGAGTVVIEASQSGNANYNAAPSLTQSFIVNPKSTCSASGNILREQWDNVYGFEVTNIPFQTPPTSTSQINMLEGPTNIRDNYGSRIRGYLCPPQTGNYTFFTSGDDAVELWLSSDDNPANKVKIAYFSGWTYPRDYTPKYPYQKSSLINLKMGQSYYVEVLQKEGGGADHVSVAWQLPSGVIEGPIPGSRLAPYQSSSSYAWQVAAGLARVTNNSNYNIAVESAKDKTVEFTVYPSPVQTSATIRLNSSESSKAELQLYDLKGKLVKNIYNGQLESRVQKNVLLKTEGLSNGMYVIRLTTRSKVLSKKIIINRE